MFHSDKSPSYLEESLAVAPLFDRSLFSRSLRSNRSLFGLQDLLGRSSSFRSGSSWSFRDRSRSSWGLLRSNRFYRSLGLLDFSLRCLLTYKGETILLGGVGRVNGRVDIARGLVVDRGRMV